MKLSISFLAVVSFICSANAAPNDIAYDRVPDAVLDKWKAKNGVLPGFKLGLQKIQDDVVLPDGTGISLNNLETNPIYTNTATCFVEGQPVDCPKPSVYTTMNNGQKIVVAKDAAGNTKSIKAKSIADGSTQTLLAVDNEYLTHIPGEAVDPEFQSRYIIKSISPEEDIRRNLRQAVSEQLVSDETSQQQRSLQEACTELRVVEVAVAAESSFCADFGGKAGATAEIEGIMAAVALDYEHDDLCFTAKLSHTEVFCEENDDPYRELLLTSQSACGTDGLLQAFRTYWQAERSGVQRDTAQLFSGTDLDSSNTIGCAFLGVTCSSSFAYGVNWASYTTNAAAQSNLISHEMGHNIGANHDSSTTDFMMFPSNGSNNRIFGPQSIASFLVTRNDACITVLAPEDPTTTTVAATSTTTPATTTTTTTTTSAATTTTTPPATTTTPAATTTTTTTTTAAATTTPTTTTTTTTTTPQGECNCNDFNGLGRRFCRAQCNAICSYSRGICSGGGGGGGGGGGNCDTVNCLEFGSKNPCNGEPCCNWSNRNKICLSV